MNSLSGKKDISDSLSDYFNQPFASSWANDIRSAALDINALVHHLNVMNTGDILIQTS